MITEVDVWYGTPSPSKTHMVTLDKTGNYATLVCSNKLLKFQDLDAEVGLEEVTCLRCLKKIREGNYVLREKKSSFNLNKTQNTREVKS